jgi:hypothetical protein
MAAGDIELKFKLLLEDVAALLKPRGFSKRGMSFRRVSSGNVALIAAQRSQFGAAGSIRFTFNAAIICGRLLSDEDPTISKAGVMHAHLSERIGEFLSEPADAWWELDGASDPSVVLADLAPPLALAARFLVEHAEDANMIDLWESGRSPGLTDGQRRRYLQELKGA